MKKFAFEFLSIFLAVISAFALTNWNDNRKSNQSEEKILTEIRNSIEIDMHDFNNNIFGNNMSLRAEKHFRNLIENKEVSNDSLQIFYLALFRDYPPIINKSAYESFKSNSLKTITNDSLRLQIISLYDYYYSIIEVLEYKAPEMQSYGNYFSKVNEKLFPYMVFDKETGNLVDIKKPIKLSEADKSEILSYFWRIRSNRVYKLGRYKMIIEQIEDVKEHIEEELGI